MSENATGEAEATATPLTPENGREAFMTAARAFFSGSNNGRLRQRENLLDILQNNDYRDILAECMNEDISMNAFTWAAANNHVDILQAFHDVGMDVNVKNENGVTALRNACYSGREESTRWLLDHDANVEIRSPFGVTPLMCASQCGRTKVVEMLLQKKANPDIQEDKGYTALMHACQYGYQEIVQLLLNYNANTDLKNKKGGTAWHLAKNEEIKELLHNHVNNSYVLK